MSYSTLGTSCMPQTCAVTSNRKFLLPDNPVYYKKYTNMFEYPGHSEYLNKIQSVNKEKDIQTYFGKDTNPDDFIHQQIRHNQCKKCG
jgi:hypothetical protein